MQTDGCKQICTLQVKAMTQRVHVPNNKVLGFWVIVIVVQVFGGIYDYWVIWTLRVKLGFGA